MGTCSHMQVHAKAGLKEERAGRHRFQEGKRSSHICDHSYFCSPQNRGVIKLPHVTLRQEEEGLWEVETNEAQCP